ncbi:MAG: hypothetical protein ACK4NR_06570 [Micavibrio sp.]
MAAGGWNALYTVLGSFQNLKDAKLSTLVIAAAAAFGGHSLWPEDPTIKAPVSEGRAQMLAGGVVGKPQELNGKILDTINTHFAEKGFPCDPISASETIGETMERAKNCAATSAPKAHP